MFLRTDSRTGGPTDPYTHFEETVKYLFVDRFKDPKLHPMREFLYCYSYVNTPRATLESKTEGDAVVAVKKQDNVYNPLNMSWQDITSEVSVMSENKRNSLCAEQHFAIYLRECSQLVNSNYYRQIMQFVLMFSDCLNIYGWHKRAEHECKEYYGQYDYEMKLKERLDSYHECSQTTSYCMVNNCEFAPEVCNEFVTIYLEEPGRNPGMLQRSELIDLT